MDDRSPIKEKPAPQGLVEGGRGLETDLEGAVEQIVAIHERASSKGINVSQGRHPSSGERIQISGTCLPGDSSTDRAARPRGTDAESRRFEAMLVEISSKFVNLPANEVDQEIEDAQRRICECLGLDLSSLWQWSVGSTSD